jgi:PAS domain-containing protein
MRKWNIFSAKTAAAALAVSMIFQGTAMAAPMDELDEILEHQKERKEDSLLEQTLGLSDLWDAIEDNGVQLQVKAELTPETIALLGDKAELLDGGYLNIDFTTNQKLRKWLLEAGLYLEDETFLEGSLYGDEEQLALSLPQFYEGALALGAGNLREQVMNSALAQILGLTEEDEDQIPDLDMSFYPDDDGEEDSDSLKSRLEEKSEALEEAAQVEKTEQGDVTTYAVTFRTEDIMDIYQIMFDEFADLFDETGLIEISDSSDLDAQLEQLISEMDSVLGDAITVNFDVKDGLVEKISYELNMDTTGLTKASEETESTEAVSEENGLVTVQSEVSSEQTDETILQADEDFRGTISYEFTFTNPEQPSQGIEGKIDIANELSDEEITILMNYSRQTDGSVETTGLSLEVQEDGIAVYTGTPFAVSFDASTGRLEAKLAIETEDESAGLTFSGTFSEIEKGRSFVLTIDDLAAFSDEEKAGMAAEIRVNADPEEITAPEQGRVLLELTQGGLLDLVNEVSANAQVWTAQFSGSDAEELQTEVTID